MATSDAIHVTTVEVRVQLSDWRSLSMIQQMEHLLDTGELSDCTFVVGEKNEDAQHISAHKFPLCRASEVFTAMFTGGLKEKGEIRVTDISPETFRAMLKYIYTEQLEFSNVEMGLHVMLAANKYLITPLTNQCVNFVTDKMEAGDVCKVFDVANLIENKQLNIKCIKMVQENTRDVVNAGTWINASQSFVLSLVQQDTLLGSDETVLLKACIHWAKHQIATKQINLPNIRKVMDLFLPYIRLRTLSTEEFIKATEEDCIFTLEERMQILRCIVFSKLKMPCGMCEGTRHRIILSRLHSPQIIGERWMYDTSPWQYQVTGDHCTYKISSTEMCSTNAKPRGKKMVRGTQRVP